VQHSVFDEEEVGREIEVVLEEIRRSEDDPHHVLSDALFAEAFRVHPYGRPILGTHASVAGLTRQKLLDFYGRWYTPDHLVVTAAGDFDGDALLARAEALFADARASGTPRERTAEPAPTGLRTHVLTRPFERAALDCSWPVVPFAHPDAALLDLLAFVLGEGDSSRLVRKVKEERGIADRIDASCYTPLDPGLFGCAADCDAAQAPAVIEAIVRETERVRREPVSEEELEKARRNFLASRAWEKESVSGMARKIGSSQILTGDPSFEDAYLERIRGATREELLRVADTWLDPERLTVAAVLPEGEAGALDDAIAAEAVERGRTQVARAFAVPRHAEDGNRIETYELEGGSRLHVLPRRDIPVVAARAALLGGQLVEDESTAGLGQMLAGMWLRGTRARSAAGFAERVEMLAADVDGFAGRNSCGLTLDCTSEQLAPVLDLFAEAMLEPGFSEEEIERERRETLASLARREDRLSARAFDLFSRIHWEQHPYRHPLLGTPENVTRFDAEALRAHQQRIVRADNLVVAVVGDVDPDQVAGEVTRRLAAMPGGSRVEAELPAEEPAPKELREIVETKDRAQAHLVMGFRGLSVHDPDRHALEVLSQLLAGQGGRLFLELRDRRGLAYTVSAMNVEGYAPGFFAIYMGTAPEKLDEALAGIRDELRRVLDTAPDAAGLDRARRYLIGSHAIDQQRSSSRAMQIALDARYGLGPDADAGYPDRIAAVTAEDVLGVARRVIDLATASVAIIRP
jgi:zinc protease